MVQVSDGTVDVQRVLYRLHQMSTTTSKTRALTTFDNLKKQEMQNPSTKADTLVKS